VKSHTHDRPREHLDQAVDAEADQGDRRGRDPGGEGDRELGHVPHVPSPRQAPRPPLEHRSLGRAMRLWADDDRERVHQATS
jgi:hypothetical protein